MLCLVQRENYTNVGYMIMDRTVAPHNGQNYTTEAQHEREHDYFIPWICTVLSVNCNPVICTKVIC